MQTLTAQDFGHNAPAFSCLRGIPPILLKTSILRIGGGGGYPRTDTLAVCATSAKGTASGSTRKPPDGWYRNRKSTFPEFGPPPPLIRRKLIWRPFAVEISKLLSAGSLVRALTNTSSGSCSECST